MDWWLFKNEANCLQTSLDHKLVATQAGFQNVDP